MTKTRNKNKLKMKQPPKPGSYAFKAGVRFPVKPQVAGRVLESIRAENDGNLTPAVVVDAARHPDHPLHKCFQWDDSIAAERYREVQARQLMHSVRIVMEGGGNRLAYISVNVADNGRSYLPTEIVLNDTDMKAQAIAEALAALEGFRKRFAHLEELAELFSAIDTTRQKMRRKRA